MALQKYEEGFQKGFLQVQLKDKVAMYEDLKEALNVKTTLSVRLYMTGKRELRASQIIAVEQVFKKYNITDVWGRQ